MLQYLLGWIQMQWNFSFWFPAKKLYHRMSLWYHHMTSLWYQFVDSQRCHTEWYHGIWHISVTYIWYQFILTSNRYKKICHTEMSHYVISVWHLWEVADWYLLKYHKPHTETLLWHNFHNLNIIISLWHWLGWHFSLSPRFLVLLFYL